MHACMQEMLLPKTSEHDAASMHAARLHTHHAQVRTVLAGLALYIEGVGHTCWVLEVYLLGIQVHLQKIHLFIPLLLPIRV